MEGIYGRGRAKVLVQYRVQTELMGDARSLQERPCPDSFFGKAGHVVRCLSICRGED